MDEMFLFFLLFYIALDLNNQNILWLPSKIQFERKLDFWTTLHNISKIIFSLGSNEYLASLESKIRRGPELKIHIGNVA